MSYVSLGSILFLLWFGGCVLARWLSRRQNRDTRMLPTLYAIILVVFYAFFHGKAQHWHYWWYAWNAVPNLALMVIAWCAFEARGRWPIAIVSAFGALVDGVYFGFAASGNRLPGACFFCTEATVETLQVACMIYFSGPVEPVTKRAVSYLRTRKWPWTHPRRLLQKV